jgi:hypothetical protein
MRKSLSTEKYNRDYRTASSAAPDVVALSRRGILRYLTGSSIRWSVYGPIRTVGQPMTIGLGPPGISTTISLTRHAI